MIELPKVEDIPKLRDIAGRQTEYRYFDAPMGIRFKAWSIDILLYSLCLRLRLHHYLYFADMPFDTLAKVMISSVYSAEPTCRSSHFILCFIFFYSR